MSPTLKKLVPTAIALLVILGAAFAFVGYKYVSAAGVGDACTWNECNGPAGEYCVFDDRGGFCAPQCESTADCPGGWTCERAVAVDQHGTRRDSVPFCMRPRGEQALRSGRATVTAMTGTVPGVAIGTGCTFQQVAVPPQEGLDCRWEVACGGVVLYGADDSGYNPSSSSSWPAGTLVSDASTTGEDGDPSIVFAPGVITIRDDASGPFGELTVTLTPE